LGFLVFLGFVSVTVLCSRCENPGLLPGQRSLDGSRIARILVGNCVISRRILSSVCEFFKSSMTRLRAVSVDTYGAGCLVRCSMVSRVIFDVDWRLGGIVLCVVPALNLPSVWIPDCWCCVVEG